MRKVKAVANPTGTILGDLNVKLIDDIRSSIERYFDLAEVSGISYNEGISGVLSILLGMVIHLERDDGIPVGVVENYLEVLRTHRDQK